MWTVTDKHGNRHISWMGDKDAVGTMNINGTCTHDLVHRTHPNREYSQFDVLERLDALERKLDALLEALQK